MSLSSHQDNPVDAKRLYIALIIFFLLQGGLALRLWYLQVLKGKDFAVASERNRVREVTKPAPRGLIYDRSGLVMLANRPFFDLVIIPQYLQDPEKTLAIVADLFHIPLDAIQRRLTETQGIPHFIPRRIKRNLTLHEVAMVESNKFFLPGVDVDIAPRRDYGRNESAHLFGYLGEVTSKELDALNAQSKDNPYRIGSIVGKQGVEKKFERYLKGVEGKEHLQVDAFGRLQSTGSLDTSVYGRSQARRGSDIYLTVDSHLQKAATEAFRNKNGALVAINPQTGEILAYVSHPNFNLALYQDGLSSEDWQQLITNPFKPLLDKVTGGAYPPGSTYKIITALAALEENVVGPDRAFFCNGAFTLGSGRWRCYKKEGHGWVNMRRALEVSCDVYFYQLGNLLGAQRMAKWSRLFGLGEKTGLDVNLEAAGIVPTPEWKLKNKGAPWTQGDTINASIGQGFNLTTPLQVVNMFAAMANGGRLYRPYILKKIVDDAGKTIGEEQPYLVRKIPMNPRNMELINRALFDVVQGSGTGQKARVPGFAVAGKTGTSQTSALRKAKEMEDVGFMLRDHAWFAASSSLTTRDPPEITVVAISEYDGQGGGSQAAPIVQKVIEAYWRAKYPDKFPKVTPPKTPQPQGTAGGGQDMPPDAALLRVPGALEEEALEEHSEPPVDGEELDD